MDRLQSHDRLFVVTRRGKLAASVGGRPERHWPFHWQARRAHTRLERARVCMAKEHEKRKGRKKKIRAVD
jgi:hypothetical protein